MPLFTKCILHEPNTKDGIRVSIMSRHTLKDGETQDPRLKEKLYDIHMKILSPSPRLIGAYYKRELPWSDFETNYLQEIRSMPQVVFVETIVRLAMTTNITLLCIEHTADKCHRRLLAEECQRLKPELKVVCR